MAYKKGDVNMDGLINQDDYELTVNASMNSNLLTDEQKQLADLDGDGKVTTFDAYKISELIPSETERLSKIYGFKENGVKVEIPTKEDVSNMIIVDSSGIVNSAEKIEKLLSAINEEYKLIKPLYFNQYYSTTSRIDGNSESNVLIPCINVIVNEEKNTLTFVFDGGDRGGEKVYAGNYVLTLDTHQYVSMNITSVNRYVDSLDSNSTTKALTANQGMVLNNKIKELANNVGGGVIDVTELPAITEENKNQILRYNGELYAVGIDYTDQNYYDQETFNLTVNQNEVYYFDFSKIPAFADSTDFPQYRADGNTWNDTSTPYVLWSCRYTDPNISDEETVYEIIIKQSSKYNIIIGEAIDQDYDSAFAIAEYSYNQGIIQGSLLYNNNGSASYTMGPSPYYGSFSNPNITYHLTCNGNTPAYGMISKISLRKVYSTWKKINEDIDYNTRLDSIYDLEDQDLKYFYLQHGDVCTRVPYYTSQSLWGDFCDFGQEIAKSAYRSSGPFQWGEDQIEIVIGTDMFDPYMSQNYKIVGVNSRKDRIIPNHVYHIELIGNKANDLFVIKKLSDYATSGELQATHFDQILADFDGKVGFILNNVGQLMICGINSYWGDMIQVACQVPYGWTNDKRQVSFIWDNYNRHFCVFASNTSGSWKTSRYSETLEVDTSMQDPS